MRIDHVAMYVNDLKKHGISLSVISEEHPTADIIMKKPASDHILSLLRMAPGLKS